MRLVGVVLCCVLGACAPAPDGVGSTSQAIGEPTDGFPSWDERVVHVWTNRARCDPAADLASCAVCAEKGCYGPVDPLVWNHDLARAARFHSDHLVLGGCGLQHNSPCTVVSDIDTQYTPGPCDGDPSCGCVSGTHSCGSSGTSWSARVALFGTSTGAENIAAGRSDPVSTFYQWFHEPDSDLTCGWRPANGHRANILGGSRSLGVGKALTASTWTQDFGNSGTPDGIVSGVHYPETGSSLEFRANWFRGSGPTTAMVSVDGACSAMALERGTDTNGTYYATVGGLGAGCIRYFFHFTDGATDVFYPTTGSYGINCATDWDASRPASCGVCTPDCAGRDCGSDGCGGSCGTCSMGQTCNASGSCACSGTLCGGACIDADTDPNNCGACGVTCGAGEFCAGGTCQCAPDCAGKACGDDGCGGSCGACPAERMCDGSGACVCSSGTECGGACVDTQTDPNNCGMCGQRCRGMTRFCVAGTCMGGCTPDCAGRDCGSDGCGGSCGICAMGFSCDASGACVCPAGESDCSGVCVDLDIDSANCGACGVTCGAGETCVSGSCTSMCIPDCTGKACGDDGCGGSCGTCSGGRMCDAAGACVCTGGLTDCGGACVDTTTDPSHCGACGMGCAVGETCSGGTCDCVPDCTGRTCGADGCGGTCGACAADRICTAGSCTCDAALTECDGSCVDVRIDSAHCGACGVACAGGESCVAGACVMGGVDAGCVAACDGRGCGDDTCGGSCGDCAGDRLCGAGGVCLCSEETTDCGGVCVDTRVDSLHCGACEAACGVGQRCVSSTCEGGAPMTDAGAGDDAGAELDAGVGLDTGAMNDAGTAPEGDGGCGCTIPGRGSGDAAAWLFLALVGLVWRRR